MNSMFSWNLLASPMLKGNVSEDNKQFKIAFRIKLEALKRLRRVQWRMNDNMICRLWLYATGTPSRKSPSHVRQFKRNMQWDVATYHMVLTGSVWQLRVYVAVTGSMLLLQWLLWDLCGCYGIYVAVTGLCGSNRVYVAVTGSMWLLLGLCWCYIGCYRVYVAVTGSMLLLQWLLWGLWLLQGLCDCYGIYVAVAGSMWLLWGVCGCYMVYVAVSVMGSMWLLRGLFGCYGVYGAVTGSMWLLQGLCGAYWKAATCTHKSHNCHVDL